MWVQAIIFIFQSADSWSGVTLATAKGFLNIVIKLLENGADPNSLTKVNLKLVNIFLLQQLHIDAVQILGFVVSSTFCCQWKLS